MTISDTNMMLFYVGVLLAALIIVLLALPTFISPSQKSHSRPRRHQSS